MLLSEQLIRTAVVIFGVTLMSAPDLYAQDEGASDSQFAGVIEEVIVTATKRSETLGEVPIAISVFGKEILDQTGVQELRELSEYIPNVTLSQTAEFDAVIRIRGVGSSSRNIGFDSRVGVYLDGVYLGQSPAFNQDLINLERVEVLRGPQGTLFGKNTVAGAINMVSTKPGQEFEANVSANVFNYDGLELKADANFPLGEKFSARVSVSDRKRDGYITNVWDTSHVPTHANFVIGGVPVFGVPLCDSIGGTTPPGCAVWAVGPDTLPNTRKKLNGANTQSYRAQLRFHPNDNLDINFAIDGLKSDRGYAPVPLTDTFGSTIDHFAPGLLDVSNSEDGYETRDLFGANLNIDYDFDNGFSFRSISAYRDTESNFHNDTDDSALDFLYVDYSEKYEQTTQEFQLISPDAFALKYVVGFYYYDQDATTARDAVTGNAGWLFGMLPGHGAFSWGDTMTESWAVFMNGSYDFSDAWRLGFGFRYSDETKDALWHLDGSTSSVFGIGSTPPGGYINSRTDTNFSPTVSINYMVNDSINVYAKYSTGFKSGGYNLDFVTQADLAAGITFDKETVDSYELGLKAMFLDNRLSLNAAVFLAQYDDYQVQEFLDLGFDPETGTQLTAVRITNAAKVDTSGLELEAMFKVTDNLTINASVGLLDATFDDFPGGSSIDVADPSVPGGIRRDPINAAGKRLPGASELTAALGVQYYYTELEFFEADVLFRLDITHRGDYFVTNDNEKTRALTGTHGATFTFDIASYGIPHEINWGWVEDTTMLNGRIGLIDRNGAWDVYLWGRNLTDEDNYLGYYREFFGSLMAQTRTPRTYGIEASYHF